MTEIINPINEALHTRAIQIVNLACNDLLIFPDDGFNYSTNNSIAIYQHIRIFSAAFSELSQDSGHTHDFKVAQVASILLQIIDIKDNGIEALSMTQNRSIDEIHQYTDVVDIFSAGLAKRYKTPEEQPNGHIYYFIIALDSLLDFVELYLASFRSIQKRESFSVREASYQQVIKSMGAIISAQSALSKGMNYQYFVTSKLRLNELTQKVSTLNAEKSDISNQRKKGGIVTAQKFDTLRRFIKSEGAEIWGNDSIKEMKIGYVAEILRNSILNNPICVDLKIDNVPKIDFFKKYLKDIAPAYARKGGRPKNNQ